jgi:hypothetical protein
MPLRIGFFQFELSHPNNAPHIGMCLLVPDLVAQGHRVEACLVGASQVPALLDRIRERRYDLVALDSIFPIDVVNLIKDAYPDLPVVVGGVNALALFLASAADFAVVGPGRRSIVALAAALAAQRDSAEVPNLFFRIGSHVPAPAIEGAPGALAPAAAARPIDHSGAIRRWDVREEVEPYAPLLDWEYLGNGRRPDANHHLLSLVPEFGCPYQADALAIGEFAGLARDEPPGALLPHLDLSPRAVAALRPFLANNGGCSFCVFRFQDFAPLEVEATVDLLMVQLRHLAAVTGARDFSLQTENPFRFLRRFLERVAAEKLPLERLALRTMATVLLAKEAEFRRALALARAQGIQIVLQQVGFENFDQRHLDLYNKGITVAENLRAARLLSALQADYGETIAPFSGHGLILFDPWTTVEDLARNVAAIEREAPFLLAAVGLNSKLVFYDPFNPIFRKARNEGLVFPSPRDYGWDFTFADPRTRDFVSMVRALERHLRKRLGAAGRDAEAPSSRGYRNLENELFRRALASYRERAGDPAAERAGFFALAGWIDAEVAAGRAG